MPDPGEWTPLKQDHPYVLNFTLLGALSGRLASLNDERGEDLLKMAAPQTKLEQQVEAKLPGKIESFMVSVETTKEPDPSDQ